MDAAVITAMRLEAIRAMHEEATAISGKRRRARWRSALEVIGVVLLLAAIAS
jgi:hypothetical protein